MAELCFICACGVCMCCLTRGDSGISDKRLDKFLELGLLIGSMQGCAITAISKH